MPRRAAATTPAPGIPATLKALTEPIDSLNPRHPNPRRGNLELLVQSLEAHGQYRPIVANRPNREVLAGNHTLAAARELGWQQIAVTWVDVDEETATRIMLIDNRANDLAGYDDTELLAVLQSLGDLDATGYGTDDLEQLLNQLADQDPDADARDTEPGTPPLQPTTRPGDLITLGDHRLICGNATDPNTVARLLEDRHVEMVWTDPPYGVDLDQVTDLRHGTDHGRMAGDGHADTHQLVTGALTLAANATTPGGAIYVCHPETGGLIFRQALAAAGWAHKQTLIWVKQQFVIGRQDYQWQHEPILYGWKPGAAHRWHGGFDQGTVLDDDIDLTKLDRRQLVAVIRELQNDRTTTIIREDRPHVADIHPTVKPVALVARCLRNSSTRGATVYEPFAGSGSTLIAAQNTGRRCLAVEVDAGYCDVIIDRWQRHTDQRAQRP
jgi:DNA modification methylase